MDGRRPRVTRIREIVFIEAAGNHTEHPVADGTPALTSTTLSAGTEHLPDAHIACIHRSAIVHVERVTSVDRPPQGRLDLHRA